MKNIVAFRTILYDQNTEFFDHKGVVSTHSIELCYPNPILAWILGRGVS